MNYQLNLSTGSGLRIALNSGKVGENSALFVFIYYFWRAKLTSAA
jgi:hypothetical protein